MQAHSEGSQDRPTVIWPSFWAPVVGNGPHRLALDDRPERRVRDVCRTCRCTRGRSGRSGGAVQMSDCVAAGGEIMSVALAEHTGPWTADDVEALPDADDHARFEVYEGGVLVVSPAPGVGHQRASYWLHRALS